MGHLLLVCFGVFISDLFWVLPPSSSHLLPFSPSPLQFHTAPISFQPAICDHAHTEGHAHIRVLSITLALLGGVKWGSMRAFLGSTSILPIPRYTQGVGMFEIDVVASLGAGTEILW